jgi:MFS family permease
MPNPKRNGSFVLLYAGCLAIAGSYGLTLLLPSFVTSAGGSAAQAGLIFWFGGIGAIGSLLLGGRLTRRAGPIPAALAGAVLYAVATATIAATANLDVALAAGVLLGAGWALFFTSVPIVVSALVSETDRTFAFLVLAGFNALGMGLTPVIGRQLVAGGLSYRAMFLLAAALSIAAAFAFAALLPLRAALKRTPDARAAREDSVLGPVREVLASPARPYLVMVLLGACVFTTLTIYQTTFASSRGMNSAFFYLFYTLGVIVPRFTVSRRIGTLNPARATTTLLAGMCVALTLFLLVGRDVVLYAACSVLVGICYGLAYPLIQAQAAARGPEGQRHWVLWYFSLAYFTGVYGFPVLAGLLIDAVGYQGLAAVLLAIGLAELGVSLRSGGSRAWPRSQRRSSSGPIAASLSRVSRLP